MNNRRGIRRGALLGLFLLLGVWLLGSGTLVGSVQAQTDPIDNISTPPPGQSPVEVYIELGRINLFSIDEREETFEVEASIYAEWFDERQAFDRDLAGTGTKVFQGETAVEMLKDRVWWPDLEIVDSRGPRERLHTTLTIDYDGWITYAERFQVNIAQPFYLYDFPFDSHEISFTIESFYYSNEEVVFLGPEDFEDSPDRSTGLDDQLIWWPREWNVENIQSSVDRGGEFEYSSSTLSFELYRLATFYLGNVVIPLMLIVSISWAVFWMDFGNMHLADRLSVSFTSVLTVVAFDFVTADNLPRLPYSTILDVMITFSYVVLTLSVLENVIAYAQHKRNGKDIQRIDLKARRLFPLIYFVGLPLIVLVRYLLFF